ncbi:uncharacterized protein LOC110944644 [Helianthus annuus]|uniref:uncharacterized protein LOC110944644 n=1 Tax=Helianthus annuus TaxID=4232 RepID=UPI000B8FA155|nr:uncharacterized protein LOC110944644 [Helianthus annuus]
MIAENRTQVPINSSMTWKCWTPLKCKILVWRADVNWLPTRAELLKRGVAFNDGSCAICNEDLETMMHLFTGCVFSDEIWARVGSWCRLSPIYAFEVKDLLKMAGTQTKTKKEKYILRGIIYTTMWSIWNERNARIFKGNSRKLVEVVEIVKSTAFLWIRHRSSLKGIDWNI